MPHTYKSEISFFESMPPDIMNEILTYLSYNPHLANLRVNHFMHEYIEKTEKSSRAHKISHLKAQLKYYKIVDWLRLNPLLNAWFIGVFLSLMSTKAIKNEFALNLKEAIIEFSSTCAIGAFSGVSLMIPLAILERRYGPIILGCVAGATSHLGLIFGLTHAEKLSKKLNSLQDLILFIGGIMGGMIGITTGKELYAYATRDNRSRLSQISRHLFFPIDRSKLLKELEIADTQRSLTKP